MRQVGVGLKILNTLLTKIQPPTK